MIKKEIMIPRKKKSRLNKEEKIEYENQLRTFGTELQELEYKMIGTKHVTEKLKTSARGWCYLLEGFGIITKDEFIYTEGVINYCREVGYLPIDFVAVDIARKFYHVEPLIKDYIKPKEYIYKYIAYFESMADYKDDIAFWESQEYYIQMSTEKIDIRNLFNDLCEKYHIPISNAKGWTDMNSRNIMAQRYKQAEEIGLKPVLLYFGDLDPAGVLIADKLKENLKKLENATGWNPDNLIVDKFGLTFKFIEDNKLLWIDNLITGGGRNVGKIYKRYKAGDKKARIFDYEIKHIEKYGARKCEANAVLTVRKVAQADCEATIQKYLGDNPFEVYDEKVDKSREKVRDILNSIKFKERMLKLIEDIEKL